MAVARSAVRSTDCHFHVFGDPLTYPLSPESEYTPRLASIDRYRTAVGAHGVRNMVLIQPTCYGTDNRCMLDGLAALNGRGRCVVAIGRDCSSAEVQRLDRLGARGVRFNTMARGGTGLDLLTEVASLVGHVGWHVQIYTRPEILARMADDVLATGLGVVVDHFGQLDPAAGLTQPVMRALSRMLATGRCWVKLSAPFRMSRAAYPFEDLVPYVKALIDARADRLVWGSDWPYVGFESVLTDSYDPLAFLMRTIEDAGVVKTILEDNPARLYGFEPA